MRKGTLMRLLFVLAFILSGCRSDSGRTLARSCEPDMLPTTRLYCAGRIPDAGSCRFFAAEFAKACEDGCLMHICGSEVGCQDRPAACTASCDDVQSGAFWSDLLDARVICTRWKEPKPPVLSECIVAETEKLCPALVGTRWTARVPEIFNPETFK
jgi:hypothetical protein